MLLNPHKAGLFEGSFFWWEVPPSIYLKYVEVKKNADIICYMLTSLVSLQQGNVKKSKKLMKIVNIEEENFHSF